MKARISLKINAGARTTELAGRHGDAWKLRVAAPPVDGKANEAIIRFFAKLTGLHASAIRIASGFTSSNKILEFDGLDPSALDTTLEHGILNANGHRTNSGSPPPRKP